MVEKTKEELNAELEALEKQILERKIAKAKAEAEEAEQLEKEEANEKLREEIREEERENILKQMGEKSKVEPENAEKNDEMTAPQPEQLDQIRAHYGKTLLKDIPATPGTKAVFEEDKAYFAKAVEKDTWELKWKDDRKITGRTYEDIVRSMSQGYMSPEEVKK